MSVIIDNKYKLIKQIGEGGCARTYLGEHLLLGAKVCVKQSLETTFEDKELLKREANLMYGFSHHALVSTKDFLRLTDGSYAIVMNFIEGKDLFKVREEDYPNGIDPEHVCWIAQRQLNALHHIHFFGILHCDVKPPNILITEEHQAILVDYGLSIMRPTSRTKCIGFTQAFAAPEQLAGKPPIPETDIYGFGLSMIYALGGDIGSKTMPKSVPRELQDFFLKMVIHDPMKRPKSASELNQELSQLRIDIFGRKSSQQLLKIKK